MTLHSRSESDSESDSPPRKRSKRNRLSTSWTAINNSSGARARENMEGVDLGDGGGHGGAAAGPIPDTGQGVTNPVLPDMEMDADDDFDMTTPPEELSDPFLSDGGSSDDTLEDGDLKPELEEMLDLEGDEADKYSLQERLEVVSSPSLPRTTSGSPNGFPTKESGFSVSQTFDGEHSSLSETPIEGSDGIDNFLSDAPTRQSKTPKFPPGLPIPSDSPPPIAPASPRPARLFLRTKLSNPAIVRRPDMTVVKKVVYLTNGEYALARHPIYGKYRVSRRHGPSCLRTSWTRISHYGQH